jgi:4-carboxymuconolactone decarboxylase
MRDIHKVFTEFKDEFPEINRKVEDLGQAVHLTSGPLAEKTRWLVKVAISAAAGRHRALETHLEKAREAGATDDEVKQVLLLLIPTCGFPSFMEAYSRFRGEG